MKTIGVLGGLGPQATIDFEEWINHFSQQFIPQRANTGYPPMVVYYFRHPPVIVGEDMQPIYPLQPEPRLLEAAQKLGTLADFLVITANGPHLIQDEIEMASGREVLSMIDVTIEEVQRRQFTQVGVLGFGEPFVYQIPLEQLEIPYETLPEEMRARLDEAVFAVWEGRISPHDLRIAREAIEWMRAAGMDGIIMGCTEIPLLLGELAAQPDLVNPTELLAKAAVKYALDGQED